MTTVEIALWAVAACMVVVLVVLSRRAGVRDADRPKRPAASQELGMIRRRLAAHRAWRRK